MPIKQQEVLSRSDFDQAVVHLRLNVSDVSKATGIPRTYLSEFRNGDRKLRPEHQAKLRDFFESKGVEFDDEPEAPAPARAPERRADVASPHPRLRAMEQVRCYFPVADGVPDEVVAGAMNEREQAEAELAVVLLETVEKNEGIFGGGEFTDASKERLQAAFSHLAKIGLLELYVRGFPGLKLKPSTEQVQTVRDVIIATFRKPLEDAGLVEPEPQPEPTKQEAEAV